MSLSASREPTTGVRSAHSPGTSQSALSPVPLMQLSTGFWSFKTLAAAVELDLFTRLAGGRLISVEGLGAELGVENRPADLLLAACASIGLLEKEGAGYRNSALAEEFLVVGKPYYFGGFVRYCDVREYPAWHRVVEALRTNRPLTWSPQAQESVFSGEDTVMTQLFWEAMHSISTFTARTLGRVYDFDKHLRLLDVGGGSGAFPIELCRQYRQLGATIVDLPHVREMAVRKTTEAGLDEVIEFVAGDFLSDEPMPDGHDVALLSLILHDWDESTCRTLLGKCLTALDPGGVLIISELMLNPERTGPPEAALMGMNMLVETQGGKNYSETEYREWLQDTGFVDIDLIRFEAAGANGVLVARKPDGRASGVPA